MSVLIILGEFMRVLKKSIFLLIFIFSFLQGVDNKTNKTIMGTEIKVHNKTLEDVYVATYYAKEDVANRVSEVKQISSEDMVKLYLPKRKFTFDRIILFSYQKEKLKEIIEGKKYKNTPQQGIGFVHGNTFYIAPQGAALVCYKLINWSVVQKTKKFLNNYFGYVSKYYSKIKPGDKRVANVRVSKDLPKQEIDYLNKRKVVTKNAIEKIVGQKIEDQHLPNIAVCASGGGYRAMQATLGLFMGLERTNLLDTITYAAGLSGSTWFISPWLYFNKSVSNYKMKLKSKVEIGLGKKVDKKGKLKLDFPLMQFTSYAVLKKKMFGQKLTSVDIYGNLLADKLFSDLKRSARNQVKLTDLVSRIEDGKKPFPILTAVQPGPPFTWFEFTPYEIGPSLKDSFVPTWSFGRRFLSGKSQDKDLEQSLGFYMAIWGSAYTATLQELFGEMGSQLPEALANWIDSTLVLFGGTSKRVSPAKLDNPNFGLNGVSFKNMKELTLIDAGLDFNLPFPPVLRPERKVDIIIVCDASASAHEGAPAMRLAEKWAQEKGIKFPKIDYNVIGKDIYSVFKDENDPAVPTIIYFSLVKNTKFSSTFDPVKEIQKGFCNTFNFVYKPEQFEMLTGLTEFNFMRAKDTVIQEIKDKIEMKKNGTIEKKEYQKGLILSQTKKQEMEKIKEIEQRRR
jgi:cytosolic phospholipase A2